MLTIKTSNKNSNLYYKELSGATIYSTGSSIVDDITISYSNHGLRENDKVVFRRKDGEKINFFKECDIKTVSDTGFTIEGFGKYTFDVESCETGTTIQPSTDSITDLTKSGTLIECLILNLASEHIFAKNRDDVNVKRRYLWNVSGYTFDGAIVQCPNDYYIFNDVYLERNTPLGLIIQNVRNLTITALTENGEIFNLTSCFVGSNNDGSDDRLHFYIPKSSNQIFIDRGHFEDVIFIADDIRFMHKIGTMSYGMLIQPNTTIEKVCGELEIDFGIGENFEVNLFNGEQLNKYVQSVENESINNIIDYERYQFSPMYYSESSFNSGSTVDNFLKPVEKITFQLNFREKIMDTGSTGGDDVYFGTWETNEFGYWNNYSGNGVSAMTQIYSGISSDLLGYLGYTDADVYYQKDAIKKSFIRLSFYDSPNRATQKLLYYSTVFFDTNKLSNDYIKDLGLWRNNSTFTPKFNELVFDPLTGFTSTTPSGIPLVAEMSCTGKNDDTMSSDGFYIHLFKGITSGNTCTPIYMKVEFNNAKYGKLVPMIYPVNSSETPISPTGSTFPQRYVRYQTNASEETYTWTDIDSLMRDMYIKLLVKYNFKTHEYVWFLPRGYGNGNGSNIKFQLFEPRITGYDSKSN